MLRFIIGTNGEARRKMLYEDIAKESSSILIVPEQYSFESEKLLDEFLGPEKAGNVEVLGFSRLCNSIFRKFGGLAGEYTDDTTKLLLMGAALSSCADELDYYRKNIHGTAFIKKLVSMDNELKNAAVAPSELALIAEKGGIIGRKAKDLSVIFELYNAMLEKSYIDPLSDIKRACDILSENDFFSEKAVFIDNFTGFTGSEYKLLSIILNQSPLVEISLCCDSVYDLSGGTGLFSKTQRTAGRLEKLAREAGAKVMTPVFAEAENDLRPGAIIDIEENFFRDPAQKSRNFGEVRCIKAVDPYDEANFVAVMARSLAEEQGYRWRDMAVIARDLSAYEHALPAAFRRAGIPLYMDRTESLSAHPLSAFISASLSAVRENFSSSEVLRLLKTGILPVSTEDISEFENYCFVWNIKGPLFLEPFTGSPQGFRELQEDDSEILERLNSLRERIIKPLEKLKKRIFGADGKEFSEAFYEYLCECEVTEGLRRLYDELSASGETGAAENLDSFWSYTVSALDRFSSALGGVRLEKDNISKLFEFVIEQAEIGVLPHTLDCVSAGTADRIRPSDIKAVFIIGLCDGVFPARPSENSLFTDEERKILANEGIDLGEGENDAVLSERMYAYTAFTSASEKVFASYPGCDISSEEQSPSVLIGRLRDAVGALPEESTSGFREDFWLCSESFAFEHLASFGNSNTGESAALKKYFSEKELWAERAQKLGTAVEAENFALKDAKNAENLFGKNFRFSPTKLDTYSQCPFSYFIKSGLVLKERQKAELSPLSAGTLIHHVLSLLIPKFGGRGLAVLSDEELRAEVDLVLKEYLDSVMGSEKGKTARFMYLFRRTAGFVTRLLKRLGEEFFHSEFVPYAFEEPLGGENVGFYQLETPDGRKISVEGTIDRVDVLEKDGERYVRVVDYKTGSKDFALCDVYYGINIQMLVYLFSIQTAGKKGLSGAVPSGVLYMPAKNSVLKKERNDTPEQVDDARRKNFRMNGLLLDDPKVLDAMEPGLGGIYIPVKQNKIDKSESVASLAEFGVIKKHIDSLLINIAGELSSGKICAVPFMKNNSSPCDYCRYKAICRRSDSAPFVEHETFKKNEFFEKVKGGDGNV
ncbi:MAG: PD-(D/E)XK nuclease family protein [Oscillospiraceae bacterium]|nr:PD-(D/E)XK nuclease family protein [Oscillospiraceae bacterium]